MRWDGGERSEWTTRASAERVAKDERILRIPVGIAAPLQGLKEASRTAPLAFEQRKPESSEVGIFLVSFWKQKRIEIRLRATSPPVGEWREI